MQVWWEEKPFIYKEIGFGLPNLCKIFKPVENCSLWITPRILATFNFSKPVWKKYTLANFPVVHRELTSLPEEEVSWLLLKVSKSTMVWRHGSKVGHLRDFFLLLLSWAGIYFPVVHRELTSLPEEEVSWLLMKVSKSANGMKTW